ncbi:hypothetical protein IFM89_039303, partial [Coptis chinensis]
MQDQFEKGNVTEEFTMHMVDQENQVELLLQQEQMFWKQKSRTKWDNDNDKSTKFFHAMANRNRNDIFLFCNASMRSIKQLVNLLQRYQDTSGQLINKEKCKLFLSPMNTRRKLSIQEVMGIKEGMLPEKYLGVPLVMGRVTKAALAPLVDKIRNRAARWAGKMLSFQGRVVLARH